MHKAREIGLCVPLNRLRHPTDATKGTTRVLKIHFTSNILGSILSPAPGLSAIEARGGVNKIGPIELLRPMESDYTYPLHQGSQGGSLLTEVRQI